MSEYRASLRAGKPNHDASWSLRRGLPATAGPLSRIAFDAHDPERAAFRALLVEGASDYRIEARRTDPQQQELAPPDLVVRVEGWLQLADPWARGAAAVMLTAFGVTGHERQAVDAAEHDPVLLEPALKALALSA